MALEDHEVPDIREMSRMQAKLSMFAWSALNRSVDCSMTRLGFSEMEVDFVKGMYEQSVIFYKDIDNFVDQLINDHAGLALMQAAMSPYIDKMDGENSHS